MLDAARAAPNLLCEAGDRIVEFLHGQLNSDGGGKDRAGDSDLYYTVFVLDGLTAMGEAFPVDATAEYLRRFGDGTGLDFVHRACLARCWAALPGCPVSEEVGESLLRGLEDCRTDDGGYGPTSDSESGTVYDSFLAFGAYEDLGRPLPRPADLGVCLDGLRTDDGAYANEQGVKIGTTPATAAAAILAHRLSSKPDDRVGEWLLARARPGGGFLAFPEAPIPDLLSTATALHALAQLGVPFTRNKDRCLDFVDSLWTGQAFCGHWADEVVDSEYTYYALLALGHLGAAA